MHTYESKNIDMAWQDLMRNVLHRGVHRPDRTGAGTWALFGTQLRFVNPLGTKFPAVTTKKLFTGQVWAELAGFLRGAESLREFHTYGCKIWDANAKADYWLASEGYRGGDDVGRIYGAQWRDWVSQPLPGDYGLRHTDQLANVVEGLRKDPYGRRHLVTAYNPGELLQMCLPPCHVMFQFFVEPDVGAEGPVQVLHLRVDMRSVDLFLGLPFDLASYATLQALVARDVGMLAGDLIFQMGDSHIYCNHEDAVLQVLGRAPRPMPMLVLDPAATWENFKPEHAQLVDYDPHPAVAAAMNV